VQYIQFLGEKFKKIQRFFPSLYAILKAAENICMGNQSYNEDDIYYLPSSETINSTVLAK
jgi:hypothetical protein